jgi:hypothetical protein
VATAAAGDGTAAAQSAYPGTSTSRGSEISSISAGATDRTALLQALKDEIFGLETDRLAGRITQQQYDEHKAAFDVVLRRALSRTEL